MIIALGGTDDLGMRDCRVQYLENFEPQILGTEGILQKDFSSCGEFPRQGTVRNASRDADK